MRNTILWFALVLIAVALVTTWVKFNSPLCYQGKPLARWLTQLQSPNSTDRQTAEEAVKAIGTNAIPTLVKYLGRTNTWLGMRATEALTPAAKKLGLVDWDRWSENYYHSRAMCAFRTLGTNAQIATPALLALMTSPQRQIKLHASFALCYASPNDATKEALRSVGGTNRDDKVIGLKMVQELIELHRELAPEIMRRFTNAVPNSH